MKKLWMFLSLIGLACTGRAQNVPSYVPTNGLVGWWPFNGNANDESGNGNNGTVNGAILTSDRFGAIAKAYNFDGIDDWIFCGTIPGLSTATSPIVSVGFWVNSESILTDNSDIFDLRSANNSSLQVLVNSPSSNNILQNRFNAPGNCGTDYLAPLNYETGRWFHIVDITNYISNVSQLYINGNLVSTQDISPCSAQYNYGSLTNPKLNFGSRFDIQDSRCCFFKGRLDDIVIWNRALTQQEITNLYNASTSTPAPCPTLPVNLQNGLVGYWPFCGNANDESGNGNNGTVNGATLTSDRFGNSNRAFSFDGSVSNADFIQTSSNPLSAFSSFTISYWMKRNSNPSTNWSFMITANNSTYEFFSNSDSLIFRNFASGSVNFDIVSRSQINPDKYYNVLVTSSNNKTKLYIDGIAVDSTSTFLIPTGPGNLYVGKHAFFTDNTTSFSGKLDDICIWNRALDSTEITQLYQTQSSNSSQGNVGINVVAPQRNLHVKDVIRLEPRSTPPENPVFGDMYIDAVLKKLRVYDGTAWQNCW